MDDVSSPSDPVLPAEPALHAPDAPVAPPAGPAGVLAARRHLMRQDADLAALIRRVGRCGLQVDRAREPYESLIRAIAYQQLHGRAAEAILGRLVALAPAPFPEPDWLLAQPEEALRACGFSGSKIRAMHAVCEGRLSGLVPTRRQAARLADEALIERLVSLRGIGRWTVEMLLIFTLGRMDVMPVDDFGVREGYRRIKALDAQPKPKELARLTEGWAPYRTIASWYLWRAADEAKPTAKPNAMTQGG